MFVSSGVQKKILLTFMFFVLPVKSWEKDLFTEHLFLLVGAYWRDTAT